MSIESKLYSLAEVVAEAPAWHFTIPIYQRLYVWGDDQVRTLLSDLASAHERDAPVFFLGGMLLVEQDGDAGRRRFDIIDGQQRLTTLWLLCQAWQGALRPFLTTGTGEAEAPRLRFAIRPRADEFLRLLALGQTEAGAGTEEDETRGMRAALMHMQALFETRRLPSGGAAQADRRAYLAGLAEFIFTRVRFVVTRVPRETDLNKLFEVINNRGVQLRHHEILKARMLEPLDAAERGVHAVLWDACADMDNFIERSLAGVSGLPGHAVGDLFQKGLLADPAAVCGWLRERMTRKEEAQGPQGLAEILAAAPAAQTPPAGDGGGEGGEPTSTPWVRSIVGFPLLLQHVLRIWLADRGRPDLPRLLDQELLSLFGGHFFTAATGEKAGGNVEAEETAAGRARSFIALLWRVRVLFDLHVIKWADLGAEEVHLISRAATATSEGRRYVARPREAEVGAESGFCLLQSMLYHSQEITTQYWLTPLLCFIHRHAQGRGGAGGVEEETYFRYLRHLDTHLLGSAGEEPLVVRTRRFMEDPWRQCALVHEAELQKAAGVRFAHYWFYKLEFVLWYRRVRDREDWRKFRMTAKNSVEHVCPQTATERDHDRADGAMDHFGNLALVSRSINSEYGNLPFNEKRARFLNKSKSRLDSLKMALIYENERWNDARALEHQAEMIRHMNAYCAEVEREAEARKGM